MVHNTDPAPSPLRGEGEGEPASRRSWIALTSSRLPCLLLVITVLLLLGYLLRGGPALLSSPLSEDAFYVFSVSRNLAQGQGLSYENGLLTNGFQPLIAFLYVPAYWMWKNNPLSPLWWVYALNILFYFLSALLIAKVTRALGGAEQ